MQRTIKYYVKTWAMTNLKMEEQDWNSIQVEKLVQSSSESGDIIFLSCQSAADVSTITSHARNLPQGGNPNDPRIIMYVDPKARVRFSAIQLITKTIHDLSKNTVQTSVRAGRNNFLLRKKPEETPPLGPKSPLIIEQELPSIEIGRYKTIFTPIEGNLEEQEEMESISKDIIEQKRLESNKRQTSHEDTGPPPQPTRPVHNMSSSTSSNDPSSIEEEEEPRSAKPQTFLN